MDLKQQHQNNPLCLSDSSLYCEEEHWEDEEEEQGGSVEELNELVENDCYYNINNDGTNSSLLLPLLLLEQDLFWEDEELHSLFTKEEEAHLIVTNLESDPYLVAARKQAVEWILRVNAHYSFSPLTAVLSVNYLDRFLSSVHFQREKPWTTQLSAVACLSLAAKVEETQVPLLLDFQVEETKYVFEAKTIQRMELLILSTLKWKMYPVTPLSFLDHIIRRLGLKNTLHWEFLRRCERLLLSVIADSRSVRYHPSILATAIMLQVIDQIESDNPIEYQNQLLGVLKISKEKVDDCNRFISEWTSSNSHGYNKRKFSSSVVVPRSPKGVIDVSFSSDTSNGSCSVGSSVSSSPEPLFKKSRTQDEQMRLPLPPFNRMIVDVLLNSPR